MDALKQARLTIHRHRMLMGGETVLVALSGGPDSVCLLKALTALKPELSLNIHAMYIDHGLRPDEIPAEISLCSRLCSSLNIDFHSAEIETASHARANKQNIHDAARDLRYAMLQNKALSINASAVALGHNLDDQIETFFMHIIRGSGMKGLTSIPPTRGIYIRPLINIDRKAILEYLKSDNTEFAVDSSNLKTDYFRNKVRKTLIPVLNALNPEINKTISRTIEIIREEERYLETAVNKTMMRLITGKSDSSIELFLSPLKNIDTVLLRRILRRSLDETYTLRGIDYVHIESIIGLINSGHAGDRLMLPGGMRAVIDYSTVRITSEKPQKIGQYELSGEGEVFVKEAGLIVSAVVTDKTDYVLDGKFMAVFDADKAVFPLVVRGRKPGDYFYPIGFGKRKKLQDFFVDEKLHRDARDTVPVVTSGGQIIWVSGHRPDERFKPTSETERLLILTLKKGNR